MEQARATAGGRGYGAILARPAQNTRAGSQKQSVELPLVAPAHPIIRTILDQVWITTSGFFTMPSFMTALLAFGADRILFSVEYPYASNRVARAFLDLMPVSPTDREKIAHGNADALLKLRS